VGAVPVVHRYRIAAFPVAGPARLGLMVAALFAMVTTGACPLSNLQIALTCALTVLLALPAGIASVANIAEAAAARSRCFRLYIFMPYPVDRVEKKRRL
jgi:hypothetical protein